MLRNKACALRAPKSHSEQYYLVFCINTTFAREAVQK